MDAASLAAMLADGVLARERPALARAITLTESSRGVHREIARDVLERLVRRTGKAIRIGVSGVPGVGKSTFIEALGLYLIQCGHRVAVLAVDPSSEITGGSILGDKTRMERLSLHDDAFVRPSPTGGQLGGVTRMTRESMLLCEAAGFDVILVETVGVGQSETRVAGMVDCFLLLMLPGAGDELQGIKKGVLEIADIVAVNKADGGRERDAEIARRACESALSIVRSGKGSPTPTLTISALTKQGLESLWEAVRTQRRERIESGAFAQRRERQRVTWLWQTVEDRVLEALRGAGDQADPAMAALSRDLESAVRENRLSVDVAASRLIEAWRPTRTPE